MQREANSAFCSEVMIAGTRLRLQGGNVQARPVDVMRWGHSNLPTGCTPLLRV